MPDATDSDDDSSTESGYLGIGAGRRHALDAIAEQEQLDTIEEPAAIEVLVAAIQDLSLTGERYDILGRPEGVIGTLRSIYEGLPEEAQPHYVRDDTLRSRINTARRQYNDWLSRLERSKEMPSWVEAGPANYPSDKAKRLSQNEREARDELKDRIDGIEAAARGARQRALEAIGSSVAEQNEQSRQSEREQMRDRLETGDIVRFRNPRVTVGRVIRVNKKTATCEYPNPRAGGTKPMSNEPEPDTIETRVDLDSDWLTILTDEEVQSDDDLDYESVAEIRAEFDDDGGA